MNLSDPRELASLLEALLLAHGKPLSLERLAELFEDCERPEPEQLKEALAHLRSSCEGRAFELTEVATGYRLQVRADYAPWVGRLWEERPQRYSRAFLETLALIAYRQPITRGEIEDIRGVTVNSHIIKTLFERDWIRVVGHRDVPGRPAMLATTREFLDYFNLKNLDELPPLAELRELVEETMNEPEPAPVPRVQPDDSDPDVPSDLQARADLAVAEAGGYEADELQPEEDPQETSFHSLLSELDRMEQGLKTDFDDLIETLDKATDEAEEETAGESVDEKAENDPNKL